MLISFYAYYIWNTYPKDSYNFSSLNNHDSYIGCNRNTLSFRIIDGYGISSWDEISIYSVGFYLLNPYIRRFLQAHPEVNLHVEYTHWNRIYAAVAGGEMDLGVVAYPEKHRSIEIIPLAEDELVMVCSPKHRLAGRRRIEPAGLAGERFVTFAEGIPSIIFLVGNLSAYESERDRHLIYIDGGLITMSFILALETLHLASCVIGWPDIELRERKLEKFIGLEKYQRCILCIAVGYPNRDVEVPYCQKRSLDEILNYNRELAENEYSD